MDNHGLLNLTRQLAMGMHEVVEARKANKLWFWNATPIAFPESKCPYCKEVIRSQYIWFMQGMKLNLLLGAFKPEEGKKVRLVSATHPHSMGGQSVCIGSHPNGAALLATGPNMRDIPLGAGKTALWINKYWGPHWCSNLEKEIISHDSWNDRKLMGELIKP